MADEPSGYRFENGAWLIELDLRSVEQLFDSMDPAPFRARDLDRNADEWIVGAVREFPPKAPLRLVIHLPRSEIAAAEKADLAQAFASHFSSRREDKRRELRYLLRNGRLALVAGLAFLGFCLGLRELAAAVLPKATGSVVQEGLVIIGWVAMWRPAEIFLYDWWPLLRMARLHAKIAAMPIEIRVRDPR